MSSTNGTGAKRSVPIDQAEALLRSLAGVKAVQLVCGPDGRVLRVRLETDGAVTFQQLARNVQSALLAQFGLLIDPRSIELVPGLSEERSELPESTETTGPEVVAAGGIAVEPRGVRRPPASADLKGLRRTGLELLEVPILERYHQHRVRCRVELGFGSRVVIGEAEVVDGVDAALEVTARAVLMACRQVDPVCAGKMELEGVRTIELAGLNYVVAGVRALELRGVHHLAGVSVVQGSGEEAAALAMIQAVEQWLKQQSPASYCAS